MSSAAGMSVPREATQPVEPRGIESIDDDRVAAALTEGRYRDADGYVAAVRDNASDPCRAMVLLARVAIERRDWPTAISVTPAACDGDSEGFLWYARGLAAARAIGRSEQLAAVPAARDAADRLADLAREEGPRSRAELRRVSVFAAVVASQDERDELQILLAHGADLADSLDPGIAQDAPAAFDELAGDLWLQVDRYQAAREAYERALARDPRRPRAMLGRARACARLGDRGCAEDAYRQFLDLWRSADDTLPELAEARQFLTPVA